MKRTLFFSPIVLIVLMFSCGKQNQDDQNTKKKSTDQIKSYKEVIFNSDSAYTFIQKQVSFGPRVPNTSAHEECKIWMVGKFQEYGLNVIKQDFTQRAYNNLNLNLTNIIAEYKPEQKKRIIIASHWDSRHIAEHDTANTDSPIDGANDGASGVGIILELARTITRSNLNVGIDFILFDGEDYGQPNNDEQFPPMNDSWCFGAQHWSKNKHRNNYYPDYGILLDMVGASKAKFAKEGVSMHYAQNIVEKVWRMAHQSGYSDYFIYRDSDQIIDDHVYVNRFGQIPMIDIIEYAPYSENGSYFGDYHHTHRDNMEIIDKNTLKAVGQTLANVLARE